MMAGLLALEIMHEVRNPLEALGNLNYLAQQEADTPQKVREYLSLADEQIRILSQIAKQTLGFAKVSSSAEPVKLFAVADSALRIHRKKMQMKNVQLIRNLSEDAVAFANQGEMLQVISSLIANAVDALPANGVLCLRLKKIRNKVQLTVADNGKGISAEHCQKIFDPFFTTKAERGTGLGLALSKRIIDNHRGTIRVRSSVRPGQSGTVFKISIPSVAHEVQVD
jgi:signal transduction histidine kinase